MALSPNQGLLPKGWRTVHSSRGVDCKTRSCRSYYLGVWSAGTHTPRSSIPGWKTLLRVLWHNYISFGILTNSIHQLHGSRN